MHRNHRQSVALYCRHAQRIDIACQRVKYRIARAMTRLRELKVSWFSPARAALSQARAAWQSLLTIYRQRLAYLVSQRDAVSQFAAIELGVIV